VGLPLRCAGVEAVGAAGKSRSGQGGVEGVEFSAYGLNEMVHGLQIMLGHPAATGGNLNLGIRFCKGTECDAQVIPEVVCMLTCMPFSDVGGY